MGQWEAHIELARIEAEQHFRILYSMLGTDAEQGGNVVEVHCFGFISCLSAV